MAFASKQIFEGCRILLDRLGSRLNILIVFYNNQIRNHRQNAVTALAVAALEAKSNLQELIQESKLLLERMDHLEASLF